MVRPGAERRDDRRRAWRIAQAHREVAQPALVTDAPDRRAAQALVEIGLGPGEKLDQRRLVEAVADLEIRLGRGLRESVPWAHELAIVAAVDAIADQRAQLFRNRALVLDREVGDAAARIELVGTDDRLGRTDVDAAVAGAAMLFGRGIDGQRQIGVDLAKEKPGAGALERERVLAAPGDAGAYGELDLHHRRRVGKHAIAENAELLFDAVAKALQPRAQHLVIVASTRIACDVRLAV